MILKERIPADFYKLFRTRNADGYMEILVSIYEENNEVYAALGLTMEECQAIINETLAGSAISWEAEPEEAASILNRLIRWGWLTSDYDEKMNSYVISFPEYSLLYTELFEKLQQEEDTKERESMLAVYSALFTFHLDPDRNPDILKTALQTSKRLGQLLSNLQDGMRAYFEKLSERKNFIGIQEVLVEEINNSDSHKYAILTTTDSFYRYKEAVKEQISQILEENDLRKQQLEREIERTEELGGNGGSERDRRKLRDLELCRETSTLIFQIEREFHQIERKYGKLIEQKTIFAKRALARVRYILQEGAKEEDQMLRLIHLLDCSREKELILEELRTKMRFTAQYHQLSDDSLYQRRERTVREFEPAPAVSRQEESAVQMEDFVPKPLYTRQQLTQFREKNMQNGTFIASEHTVQSLEDLEKLLFLWQEETELADGKEKVTLGKEIRTKEGFRFSGLMIEEEPHA